MGWLNKAAEHERLRALLRTRGALPRSALQAELGLSQPSLSRLLTSLDGVVRIGRGKKTVYALTRDVRGLGGEWPLGALDDAGRDSLVGQVRALAPSLWWLDGPASAWRGTAGPEATNRLPWVLEDLRPAGFLGRSWARQLSQRPGSLLGPDPQRWSADELVSALVLHGHDLPGNLVLGDETLKGALLSSLGSGEQLAQAARAERYHALADATLAGAVGGWPAGGEQPRFTACVDDGAGVQRHVLVKFTESTPSPVRRRWADLLVCEHLALETLREHGVAASVSQLLPSGPRICLEVTRFDRIGAHGRRGMVSLTAVDAEWLGLERGWRAAADALSARGVIGPDDAQTLHRCWWFGAFIGNTDMHSENISFFLSGRLPLAVTPAYDMVPMLWAPVRGEVLERTLELPPLASEAKLHWLPMGRAALALWQRVAGDTRVSSAFKATARASERTVAAALERFA